MIPKAQKKKWSSLKHPGKAYFSKYKYFIAF